MFRPTVLLIVLTTSLVSLALSGPATHAATVVFAEAHLAATPGPNQLATNHFDSGTSTVYFDYTISTPSEVDQARVVVYAAGIVSPGIAVASLTLTDPTSLYVEIRPAGGGAWPNGSYCIALYVDDAYDTGNGYMPILWTVGIADPVACRTPDTIGVPIAHDWNLVDVPLATRIGSASPLVQSLEVDSDLGAGAIVALAVYRNGAFRLYVPGFSSDFPLDPPDGIFVISARSGTWVPAGSAYTSGQTVTLVRDWNLVAAPYPGGGLTTQQIANEIPSPCASIINCIVKEIAVYDNGQYKTWMQGQPAFMVPATSGFWILMSMGSTWTPS